ncbi:MAG: bifunctional tRNA (5-methylaminomethyl-2-thiouridine)(34)-methyltransferase MnmD/FAD-dependent 5-carboxymethylaminomethyl-2-thiouridine(34) oxidoreductase MnmC [Rhodocyclaceae bacterium]|nr:bifunctional tRNA (5-methylaminomethyl-2-thiouridine)(34)-methyltransferase MnmD/FAD-dependent 5-carboxymethylaminomethyl-2-thiouridine(34) oxidoreductase MnmC [Rhodocyclaceae bacterium]
MPLLEPARLSFRDDGTPYSERYGDVYHTEAGGLGQAEAVFLAGNGLPGRWRAMDRFTILETGFGQGLNFLATWAAWRRDPQRSRRLHYVSTELHPFSAADLSLLHAGLGALEPLGRTLREHWPTLTPGFHRIHLDEGAVVLTLLFGDALATLPQLQCGADAIFLDGFSPACNPQMWSEALFGELVRLAAPGATLATWSVAGHVRRALAKAGFDCEREPGFGPKRERLVGRLSAHAPHRPASAASRHALVVGAGLAGTSIANRLAERGWQIELIDQASTPGAGASGNHAGVLRPLPSLDDNRLARLTRAGFLYGLHHLHCLESHGQPTRWEACGVLHLARDPAHEARQREVVAAQGLPADFLRFVDAREASALADWPLALGGWWFEHGAWVQPPSLCAANLGTWPDRIRLHLGHTLKELTHDDGLWRALDATGAEIARAPVAILANGTGILDLEQAAALPVRSARGQVAHLPASEGSPPRIVVCRLGYVSPEIDGLRCAGATFTVDDDEPDLREHDHRENLAKLDFILPGYPHPPDGAPLAGRVGFRPASPDRLPMVGAVPSTRTIDRNTPLSGIPRHPGLYAVSGFGARGLVWSALVAETLASQLDGDPLPLERDLIDAIDPARYLLRPIRARRHDRIEE